MNKGASNVDFVFHAAALKQALSCEFSPTCPILSKQTRQLTWDARRPR